MECATGLTDDEFDELLARGGGYARMWGASRLRR